QRIGPHLNVQGIGRDEVHVGGRVLPVNEAGNILAEAARGVMAGRLQDVELLVGTSELHDFGNGCIGPSTRIGLDLEQSALAQNCDAAHYLLSFSLSARKDG